MQRLEVYMSVLVSFAPEPKHPADAPLAEFNLSVEIVHLAARAGLNRALNRTRAANPGAQSSDIYQDTSEHLRLRLARSGWESINVDGQVRVVHPAGLISIVVASAEGVGLAGDPARGPITRPKGRATIGSLPTISRAEEMLDIPGLPQPSDEVSRWGREAPLWMLLHELAGTTLLLELSQPSGCRPDGRVDQWMRRIVLPPLASSGDVGVFTQGPEREIVVPVEPR